jgi:hypothetical protein
MRSKIGALSWGRIAGWVTRLILILFVAITVEIWLDVFFFEPQEYERLIGSEAACGVAKAYCSWSAFLVDNVPFIALSILAIIGLLWPSRPRRELVLGVLAIAICGYLAWRAYSVQLEAAMSGYCCPDRDPSRAMMHFGPLPSPFDPA